jgi:16S rRNA processing protein RimM
LASEREARLCVGVITGPQGVRGAVRIKSFTAEPADVASYGPVEDEAGQRRFELRVVGSAKGVVIATIAGLADRDAAERLKGTRLYMARSALPEPEEDEYYHSDLIGLPMVLRDGTMFGTVRAIHDYGAGTSLEVAHQSGQLVLVPFTRAVVPVVDIAAGRLVVDPPEGLLDNRPVEADMDAAAGDEAEDEGATPSPAVGEG